MDRLPSRIPKQAICVFKGVIFDVYQWEQELFDGTKTTFEMLKRPDTVGVVAITVDGKIMLTEEEQPSKQPFLSFPGGRVDKDEDLLSAAKRELMEETGYTGDFEFWYHVQPLTKIDWNIYTFIVRNARKVSEQKLDAGERIKLRFVDFNQLIAQVTHEDFHGFDLAEKILRIKHDPLKMRELKKLLS